MKTLLVVLSLLFAALTARADGAYFFTLTNSNFLKVVACCFRKLDGSTRPLRFFVARDDALAMPRAREHFHNRSGR